MIVIINKNKKNNKFLPILALIKDIKESKKSAKKQLMEEIINNPESLKAYKEIEVYKVAEVNEEMELTETKKEIIFTYEELLNEIITQLTKENKTNGTK